MEEAGVTGHIATTPIGSYRSSDKGVLVDVDLYPLRVEHQLDVWQEMDQRLRHWALIAEVRLLIDNRSLTKLAAKLQRELVVKPIKG